MILDNKVGEWCMCYSVCPPKGTPLRDYHVDQHDIKTMKRNVRAFEGYCMVVCERDEFWGGEKSKAYRSKIMLDPTWGKLHQCAKAQQKKTLDMHHSFFEGAYVKETIRIEGKSVQILRLSLGS